MNNRLRLALHAVIAMFALIGLDARIARAEIITFAPGDYDNAQNQVGQAVPAQTTGEFRDIFWWGTATGVGDNDYINSGQNLINNGGSPGRAVVGGDDTALNFTAVQIPNGGKSFLTVYDTTPGDGTATRNLFDASGPDGLTITADVLFAVNTGHTASAGVAALYSEGQDALVLAAHTGGGNNPDVPTLSLIFQSAGAGNVNGIVLNSVNLGAGGTQFVGDTNPGLLATQAVGSTSGDQWYQIIMTVKVNADGTFSVTGSFWTHSNPWDPNSALGTKITELNYSGPGTLLIPSSSTVDGTRVLTNPGEVGLFASVTGGFGDACAAPCNPANPGVDNVGVSITNFTIPTPVPEPGSMLLLGSGLLGLGGIYRRRKR